MLRTFTIQYNSNNLNLWLDDTVVEVHSSCSENILTLVKVYARNEYKTYNNTNKRLDNT